MAMKTLTRTKLHYRISNPGYTIYHRAALGGLAATIESWGKRVPEGIRAEVTEDEVLLDWTEEMSDQEALRNILSHSFKLTENKMIDLPGQGVGIRDDLRLAIHNGITATFLQHPKSRPGDKEPRPLIIKSVDDDNQHVFTYKALNSYAHQTAKGTGLLEEKLKGKFPETATIPQSIVPGAFDGSRSLDAPPEEVILLLFLVTNSVIFQLRPRWAEERLQHCIVIPDVIDLKAFGRSLGRIATAGSDIRLFSNSLLGRVVGGAEEAALRFLIDLKIAEEILGQRSISGCQAIGMGKVAWDKNQVNRSYSLKIKMDYDELDVFRAASQYLGHSRVLQGKKGEGFIVPSSHVPELVAANLACGRHWLFDFKKLVKEQKDMRAMGFAKGGLAAMRQAVKNSEDELIIGAFQDAWRRTMAQLFDRASKDHLDRFRLIEVERERIRNAILRTKTSDALAGWFLRFAASATKGAALPSVSHEATKIREFMFNPRNFERFQNLCLFALVSYESKTQESEGE